MLTVVLLAVMRRPAADASLHLAVIRVRLVSSQGLTDVNTVPHNSRSVREHGSMIGRLESPIRMNANVFRADG